MATYIYVIKGTLRHNEDDRGKITKLEALTVFDYVVAVRAGPGYGTEPSDPRGNLVPLARYLEKVQNTGPVDTLRLATKTGARYALLIFGSLEGGKVYSGLMADRSWSKLGEIRSGSDPVKCMVADAKFGTGHEKMLMMVASNQFNFPSGMKEVSVATPGQPLQAQHINMYFHGFKN